MPGQGARLAAEDNYRRAQSTADVCARAIANTICAQPDARIPAGYLFHYAQLCEAEQSAYRVMRTIQDGAIS